LANDAFALPSDPSPSLRADGTRIREIPWDLSVPVAIQANRIGDEWPGADLVGAKRPDPGVLGRARAATLDIFP
jgi:hypothetical protein